MTTTLYYAPGACSLAVHIVLEWIGAPYDAVAVDQHAPSFRAINPAAAVPALRLVDGAVLTQASAILHYLARRHPEAALLDETTPKAAAEADCWSDFFTGDLHPAFFPVFAPQRYTTAKDAAALDNIRIAGLSLVAGKIGLLEQHLHRRSFVVGDRRTIVDAYAVPMLNWAAAKLAGGLDAYPATKAHHARMLADPAVRRVTDIEASAVIKKPGHEGSYER